MSAGPGPAGYAGSAAQRSLGKGGVSFLVQERAWRPDGREAFCKEGTVYTCQEAREHSLLSESCLFFSSLGLGEECGWEQMSLEH